MIGVVFIVSFLLWPGRNRITATGIMSPKIKKKKIENEKPLHLQGLDLWI
jgi:hypothetical protein